MNIDSFIESHFRMIDNAHEDSFYNENEDLMDLEEMFEFLIKEEDEQENYKEKGMHL